MSDVSYGGPLNQWLAQAPPQPPPRVMGKSPAELLSSYMTHQPEQPNPAAPAVVFGKRVGQHLLDKFVSALTAPRDALTGAMQVTDPETGMPTREAMERGQGVANMAMTGGVPFAQRGAAGIFGGRLAKTADQAALARATEMEAAGHPKEDIWNATGWFKGADDKWRFEIPDTGSGPREQQIVRGATSGPQMSVDDPGRIGFSSAGAQRGPGNASAANKLTPEELAAAQARSADYQARLKARLANKPAAEPAAAPTGERIGFKSLGTDKTGTPAGALKVTDDGTRINIAPHDMDIPKWGKGLSWGLTAYRTKVKGESAIHVRDARLPPEMQGQGHGTAMYEHAANLAAKEGKPLLSDGTVTQDAANRWMALNRSGYKVKMAPNKVFRPGPPEAPHLGRFETPDGSPVFRVDTHQDKK